MFPFNSQQNRRVDLTFPITIGCLITALSLPAQARPPTGSAGNTRRQAPQPIVLGDLNGDRVVNSVDRDLFMNAWAAAAAGAAPGGADLNGDGAITLADLNILEAAAGLPLTAPPENSPSAGGSFDWRADLSGNGVVDFADLELFLAAWSAATSGGDPGQADINMDGLLNFSDLAILISLFGASVSPPTSDVTLLQPGDGFSGPTDQPAAIGVPGSPGYDAKAIARWDVVPYQEITGEFNVGVVAFHRKGIDRVEFSLDGGPWLSVTEMTENERTGVWEYWTTVNTNELPDGPIELRAVAFPNVGEPRVLEPLFLNANAHGTWGRGEVWVSSTTGSDTSGNGTEAAPFKTIWKAMQSFGSGANIDGLTVQLMEGEYPFTGVTNPYPITQDGWVTISGAPGVNVENVRIVGEATGTNNRLRIGRIHLRDLMLDQRNGWGMLTFNTLSPEIWLEGVEAVGPGPQTVNTKPFHYPHWVAAYVTDVDIRDYKDGCLGAMIARDVELRNIGSDAFTNSMLVINSSVDGITGFAELDFHPDVYQFHGAWGHRENVIVYGLKAFNVWAQGIFANDLTTMKDIAFVNVLIERVLTDSAGPTDPLYSQWQVPTNHLLLWHVMLVNHEFRWRQPNVTNLSVAGSYFEALRGVADATSLNGNTAIFDAMGDWSSNHYLRGTGYAVVTPGYDISIGDPRFENPAMDDFRPRSDSILLTRFQNRCPSTVDGSQRQEVTSVGAFDR